MAKLKIEVSLRDGRIDWMRKAMKGLIRRFLRDERGATAIEYGLIAALISVVIIAGVRAVGSKTSVAFGRIAGNMQ